MVVFCRFLSLRGGIFVALLIVALAELDCVLMRVMMV